jgi:hypothetical protein
VGCLIKNRALEKGDGDCGMAEKGNGEKQEPASESGRYKGGRARHVVSRLAGYSVGAFSGECESFDLGD